MALEFDFKELGYEGLRRIADEMQEAQRCCIVDLAPVMLIEDPKRRNIQSLVVKKAYQRRCTEVLLSMGIKLSPLIEKLEVKPDEASEEKIKFAWQIRAGLLALIKSVENPEVTGIWSASLKDKDEEWVGSIAGHYEEGTAEITSYVLNPIILNAQAKMTFLGDTEGRLKGAGSKRIYVSETITQVGFTDRESDLMEFLRGINYTETELKNDGTRRFRKGELN